MKTAIIGLGPHGKRILQVVQERLPHLNLVGVVDGKQEVLDGITTLDGSNKFTSLDALYTTHPDLKVLLVATNGPSHASITTQAIQKGVKYIMVEKPMACSVSDCIEMEKLATANGVRLNVDKISRQDALYHFLREKIHSGAWGKLRSIYIQKPGIGLGCLATHSFDLANFLTNDEVVRVTGWVDEPVGKNPRGAHFVDPGGTSILEYKNGVRAIISQIEDGAGPATFEIHLTAARILIDPKNNFIDIRERDMSIVPGPGRPPVYNKVQLPEGVPINPSMLDLIEANIAELVSDKPMLSDASFGRHAIEILVATYASHNKGNIPVEIPLKDISDLKMELPVT